MKKIIILLFNLGVYIPVIAQSIYGRITDDFNQETIIGANVILSENKGTTSDVNGDYFIKTTAGEQTIQFKFIGYEDEVRKVTVKKDQSIELNVNLKEDAIDIETVVVSAGKFEQKIEEITVSLEVIKAGLIESKNTTNIQEAIDQVPGVNITDGQANIRGGSGWSYGAGTRVQVLVDDLPLISGDAGQAQWNLISTENINQVEVIKGASSALYGSSALNGVINIRTAYPTSTPETKINLHRGYYDDAERESLNWWGNDKRKIEGFDFLHKEKVKNLDLVVGGFYLKDEGFRYKEETTRKRVNFNTRYQNQKIEGLYYGINANYLDNKTASALIWDSYEEAYLPLNNAETRTEGVIYNIDPFITYFNPNNNDKHRINNRYLSVKNDNETDADAEGQDNESQSYYTEYQYQKSIESIQLNWTTGAMMEHVNIESALFKGKSKKTNQALFTQLDKKFGDRLNLSLGARYETFLLEASKDYFLENGDSTNILKDAKPVFRAGLNYRLGKATYLRASWGQGYRFPSLAELFIETQAADGIFIYSNPQLKPESGWSSEIAIKQGFKIGRWKGFVDVAAFRMEYQDMMEFSFNKWERNENGVPLIGFKSINIGDTRISGAELSLMGTGKIGEVEVSFFGGYTYVKPIPKNPDSTYATNVDGEGLNFYNFSSIDSSELILKYRHEHIVKLDMQFKHKKTALGLSFRYNSFMKNIDKVFTLEFFEEFVPGINESREVLNKGDFIVDLRLIQELNEDINASLIINNLLNREYQTRPANLMAPRMISLKLGIVI